MKNSGDSHIPLHIAGVPKVSHCKALWKYIFVYQTLDET